MRAKTLLSALSFLAVLAPIQAFAASPSQDAPVVIKPKFGGRFGFAVDGGPALSASVSRDRGAWRIFSRSPKSRRLGPVNLNAPLYLDLVPVRGQLANILTVSLTAGVAF